jgi:hypothetical protein
MTPHVLRADRRHGALHMLFISLEGSDGALDLQGALAQLRLHLGEPTLRELAVGTRSQHHGAYQPILDALVEQAPPALARLALGDFLYPDKPVTSAPGEPGRDGSSLVSDLGEITPLFTRLPALRELVLCGDELNLDERGVTATSLRTLALRNTALSPRCVAALGRSQLPQLEQLELWLGDYAYQHDGVVADVAPLLSGAGLPALRRLRVLCDLADELVEVLSESPLLRRLRVLDLYCSTLSDAGAQLLIERRGSFAHLEQIDLTNNGLSRDAARALHAALPRVHVGIQRHDGSVLLTAPAPTALLPSLRRYLPTSPEIEAEIQAHAHPPKSEPQGDSDGHP